MMKVYFIFMIFITPVTILVSNTSPTFADYEIAWTPRVSLQEEYDDNLYLVSDGSVSDWITIISPGLYVDIRSPENMLSVDYEAGFTFYKRETDNNHVGHNISLDAYQKAGQALEVKIADRFIRSDYPLEITEGISDVSDRNTYHRNTGTAQALYSFGDENLFTVGYWNALLEYEDTSEEDTMNHKSFMEMVYWFNFSNGIGIDYACNKGEFEISDDFIQHEGKVTLSHRVDLLTELCFGYAVSDMDFKGAEEDYNIHDWSLGITYELAGDLSISLGTGYYVRRASYLEDDDTYSVYAELEKRSDRGFIKVGATKGYDENFFDVGYIGYSRIKLLEGQMSYMLVENLYCNLSGFFRNDLFPRPGINQEENRRQAGGGLSYTFLKKCSASVDYTYTKRDSNQDQYDYTDNRVIFRVVLER